MKSLVIAILFVLAFFPRAYSDEAQTGHNVQVDDDDQEIQTPKVLPALLLTPELVLNSLAIAAGVGIISRQESRDLAARVGNKLETMTSDLKEQIEWIIARVNERRQSPPSSQKPNRTLKCEGGPKVCCADFFDKFKPERSNGSNAENTKEHIIKDRNGIACCLQWDFTHGVWEVFNDRGKHLGERSCDDLSDNPCVLTFCIGVLILGPSPTFADCFKLKGDDLIEARNTDSISTFVDRKRRFLVTLTCQRSKFGKKAMLAIHKEMGTLIDIDDDLTYLKTLGKKPFLTILYSFGKETGTLMYVTSKLTPENSVIELKKLISHGANEKQLSLLKY